MNWIKNVNCATSYIKFRANEVILDGKNKLKIVYFAVLLR